MISSSDSELWFLVKQDNALAFKTLYERYWEKLYTISYWTLLNKETAKDIVQELFIDLWVKRKEITINDTVEGYIKTATRNRVLNQIRSSKIRNKHIIEASRGVAEAESAVEEHSNRNGLWKLYHKEIEKLPPKMKTVYTLIKEDGHSIADVAKKFSLSEQTVRNQLVTALKKIRSGLEHYRLIL